MAFLNGVYESLDLDITIGKDNEIFSSRLHLCKLAKGADWRGMNMINRRWHLRLGRFPMLEKQSEELCYPFRSVQYTLVDGLKSFFVA